MFREDPFLEARESLMRSGVQFLVRGNIEDAQRIFAEAMRCVNDDEALAHPDIAEIMIHLANIAMQQGRIDEAIRIFKLSAFVYSHCSGFWHNGVLALETAAHLARAQGHFIQCHQIRSLISTSEQQIHAA